MNTRGAHMLHKEAKALAFPSYSLVPPGCPAVVTDELLHRWMEVWGTWDRPVPLF